MSFRRTSVAALSLLLAGGVFAACTSSPAAQPQTTTTTSPKASTTSVAPTTAPATTAPPTTTAPTTAPTTTAVTSDSTCQNSQLKVTETAGGGAAGTIEQPFTIANTGSSPCVLDGYPVITLVPKSGTVNPQISHNGQGPVFQAAPGPITLPAGGSQSAAFVMSYTDVQVNGQTSCPEITMVKVALPGPAGTFSFAQRFYPCGAPDISVSAIVDHSTYAQQFG